MLEWVEGHVPINPEKLTDRQLDELHLEVRHIADVYRNEEKILWQELRRRAVEQGGLLGETRMWHVVMENTPKVRIIPKGDTGQ
jgi:hypothetical protein|tara:strand:- start:5079 stop:5330 length:252 start_codon:yes stop_codon:yes gene_type:complete